MAVSFAGPGPAAAHGAQRFVTSHLDAQPSNLGETRTVYVSPTFFLVVGALGTWLACQAGELLRAAAHPCSDPCCAPLLRAQRVRCLHDANLPLFASRVA